MRTSRLTRAVIGRIQCNSVRSMRKMTEELFVSEHAIKNVVKNDLKANSRAKTKRPLILKKSKRVERSKKLLSVLNKGQPIILFSDENLLRVGSVSNSRTDCYISTSKPEDVPESIRSKFRTKRPASVMMFVASNCLKITLPPPPPTTIFIDSGVKINADVYIKILEDHVRSWITSNFESDAKIVYQQDGGPPHTARKTQEWLRKNMPDFWKKGLCLDYNI